MQIKICGLSRAVDIAAVNAARPDYCGFVVDFPKSRRSVSVRQLKALRRGLDDAIRPVGVFVDAPVAMVAGLLEDGTLYAAQLHGQEDAAYIARLRALTDRPIWQAVQVRTAQDIARANESPADLVLLDAGQGSGTAFDWSGLRAVTRPFALAGGLHAGNIPQALQTGASLLDVSSGAETDGLKDFYKIQTIVKLIKGD